MSIQSGSAQTTQLPWSRRLQTKVSLLLVFLIILILGVFAAYNIWKTNTSLTNALDVRTKAVAARLAKNLQIPLWDVDNKTVDESVEVEMVEPAIAGILIRDEDGKKIFSGRGRDGRWKITKITTDPQGSFIKEVQPVERENKVVGSVEVYATNQFLKEEIRNQITQDLLQLFIISIIIILVTSLSLRRLLVRPVLRLTTAADAISKGEFDYPITVNSNDEIGLLAKAVGRLQTSLKMAMQRLQG